MGDVDKQAQQESGAKEPLKGKKAPQLPKASIGEGTFEEKMRRRSFISWLTVAWIAFSAATGAFLTMILRFMFPNVLFAPPQTAEDRRQAMLGKYTLCCIMYNTLVLCYP